MKLLCSLCAVMLILLFPQASADGARNAMAVWCKSVAPALFPFFALMPMITGAEACKAYERYFSRLMGRLFKLPGAAASAMIIAVVSGSPGGAIAISRTVAVGGLSKREADRLAFALCGLSPAYLIIGIGYGLYGSVSLGWKLAAAQLGIQLTLLMFTGKPGSQGQGIIISDSDKRVNGMKLAVESILAVCGYMVIFGAVANVIADIVGRRIGVLLLLATDLPGGSAALAVMEGKGKLIIQCAALGFGGLCVAMQNMDVLRKAGVSWKTYAAGRIVTATVFGCFGGLVGNEVGNNAVFVENAMDTYGLSLFFAALIVLPGIFFIGKNLFLNMDRDRKKHIETP